MKRTRRTYSRDYKLAAVKKVIEQGLSYAEVARDLGIGDYGASTSNGVSEGDPSLPAKYPSDFRNDALASSVFL